MLGARKCNPSIISLPTALDHPKYQDVLNDLGRSRSRSWSLPNSGQLRWSVLYFEGGKTGSNYKIIIRGQLPFRWTGKRAMINILHYKSSGQENLPRLHELNATPLFLPAWARAVTVTAVTVTVGYSDSFGNPRFITNKTPLLTVTKNWLQWHYIG